MAGVEDRSGETIVALPLASSGEPPADDLRALVRTLAERNRLLARRQEVLQADLDRRTEELSQARAALMRTGVAKDDFLANMSHELRTPLNAIIGFSDVMMTGVLGPTCGARCHEYMADIKHAGQHLLAIIDDILEMCSINEQVMELRREPVRLAELLRICVSERAEAAAAGGVAVSLSVDEAIPVVMADGTRLAKAVRHILDNAIKFTEPGGAVTVEAGVNAAGWIEVAIADTGIGIRREDMPRVLEPFGQVEGAATRRRHGTGLGLPLSRRLVELHGGRFDIASAPGEGTRVTLTFPPA
jgi:two-component system cell cycle sensor histidine kinase PleC